MLCHVWGPSVVTSGTLCPSESHAVSYCEQGERARPRLGISSFVELGGRGCQPCFLGLPLLFRPVLELG